MTTPASQDILIEAFTEAHIDGGVRLSQAAQWPHRAEDWALMLSVSIGVVALDDGKVVGTAMCSRFGDVAALNMIIVDERMRGRGLGRKLMAQVMQAAGAREMRLVATAEGLPLYEKLGFEVTGKIVQHQGIAQAAAPECAVEVVEGVDIAALAKMDLAATGMARDGLLSRVSEMGCVLHAKGGFAMLRPFGRGHVLGPVVAQDAATARALMAAAASRLAGQFLRIDMPMALAQANYAEALGLAHAGGGTAMIYAPRAHPKSDIQTYALVSQALG